jgi:hypothetical protein
MVSHRHNPAFCSLKTAKWPVFFWKRPAVNAFTLKAILEDSRFSSSLFQ